MAIDDCPDLTRLLRGERATAGFTHREHVRMAFELLRRWYRPERLASAAAHRIFLLPDPAWGERAALPD